MMVKADNLTLSGKVKLSNICPKCASNKFLGPRRVRHDGPLWCSCYKCGHDWIFFKAAK